MVRDRAGCGVDGDAVSDLLDMSRINALPHPLFACTGGGWWWPIHDIDVETGLMRIDVMGKLDISEFGSILRIRDADGTEHATDDFYTDAPLPDTLYPNNDAPVPVAPESE